MILHLKMKNKDFFDSLVSWHFTVIIVSCPCVRSLANSRVNDTILVLLSNPMASLVLCVRRKHQILTKSSHVPLIFEWLVSAPWAVLWMAIHENVLDFTTVLLDLWQKQV